MNKKNVIIILIIGGILLVIGLSNFIFSNSENNNLKNMGNKNLEEKIDLPAPEFDGKMSVEKSLKIRRSVRSYSNQSLDLRQVSQVLWAAYGISDSESFKNINLKTSPSAGATYPLEIYLMAGNVNGIAPGLYRYDPDNHKLTLHLAGDLRAEVAEACLGQRMLAEAPATVIYNAVFSRTTSRYGQRGKERYVFMDIGHSAQNVYLQATALGLATCAIGAFDDNQLEAIIKPVGEEVVLYLMPFGYEK